MCVYIWYIWVEPMMGPDLDHGNWWPLLFILSNSCAFLCSDCVCFHSVFSEHVLYHWMSIANIANVPLNVFILGYETQMWKYSWMKQSFSPRCRHPVPDRCLLWSQERVPELHRAKTSLYHLVRYWPLNTNTRNTPPGAHRAFCLQNVVL